MNNKDRIDKIKIREILFIIANCIICFIIAKMVNTGYNKILGAALFIISGFLSIFTIVYTYCKLTHDPYL